MSRNMRRNRQYYERYPEDYRRRTVPFFTRVKRFLFNLLVGIILFLVGAAIVALLIVIFVYHSTIQVYIPYALAVAGILLGLLLIYVIVKIVGSIVASISASRLRAIEASRARVELSRERLRRDELRRQMRQPQPAKESQRLERVSEAAQVGRQEQQPQTKKRLPTSVSYQDIERQVKPGQLVALIRDDGSLRLEPWSAFKILLVLGGSSSGKTTTIAEKILGFVRSGGMIVPCDPHESKDDSLFNKIVPLAFALYPGATFAANHIDILHNMRLVRTLLEQRIAGASSKIPVLLVVEELNRLLRDKSTAKEVTTILEALGEEGRGYNVFVIVGCQRVTGLSDIRKAFISFIVHRCDESEAHLVIPARYAKYCPELRAGECFVKDADGQTEHGLQVLVDDSDIDRISLRISQRASNTVDQPMDPRRPRPTRQLDPARQSTDVSRRPTRKLVPRHSVDPARHQIEPTRQPTRQPRTTVNLDPARRQIEQPGSRTTNEQENPPLSVKEQFALLAELRDKKKES